MILALYQISVFVTDMQEKPDQFKINIKFKIKQHSWLTDDHHRIMCVSVTIPCMPQGSLSRPEDTLGETRRTFFLRTN